MITLGLTGGIASGKSTVLLMFAQLGAATFDADKAVHHLLATDAETAQAVTAAFPSLPPTLPLDRKALGALVFGDEEKLALLESLLHPRVRHLERAFLRRARREGRRVAVCDIPLLLEARARHRYDAVITVACPAPLQEARALARPQMTLARYRQILARQMPLHQKRKYSDFVVHTGLGKAYSLREVRHILKKMGA